MKAVHPRRCEGTVIDRSTGARLYFSVILPMRRPPGYDGKLPQGILDIYPEDSYEFPEAMYTYELEEEDDPWWPDAGADAIAELK